MAGNLTTYGANAILSGVAMPVTLYAQGHLGNPGVDAVANGAAETRRLGVALGTPASGAATTAIDSTLGPALATEDWTHLSLWDASSSGNPWWVGPFPAPVSIVAGTTIRLQSGLIVLSFTLWS